MFSFSFRIQSGNYDTFSFQLYVNINLCIYQWLVILFRGMEGRVSYLLLAVVFSSICEYSIQALHQKLHSPPPAPTLTSLSESQDHHKAHPACPLKKQQQKILRWLPFIVKVKCKLLQPDFKKRSFLRLCLCLYRLLIFPSHHMLQLYEIPRSSLQMVPSKPFKASYMVCPLPGMPFAQVIPSHLWLQHRCPFFQECFPDTASSLTTWFSISSLCPHNILLKPLSDDLSHYRVIEY